MIDAVDFALDCPPRAVEWCLGPARLRERGPVGGSRGRGALCGPADRRGRRVERGLGGPISHPHDRDPRPPAFRGGSADRGRALHDPALTGAPVPKPRLATTGGSPGLQADLRALSGRLSELLALRSRTIAGLRVSQRYQREQGQERERDCARRAQLVRAHGRMSIEVWRKAGKAARDRCRLGCPG